MWATIIISSICFGAFSTIGYHAASRIRKKKDNKDKDEGKSRDEINRFI